MNENEVKGTTEQPVEISRWDKIKAHVKRNEDRYVSFAAGAISGAVLFGVHAYLSGYGQTTINGDYTKNVGGGNASAEVKPVVAINSPVTIEQTTNVINNFGGHMVKIVKCVETGEIFESVGKAAEAAGVSRTIMSNHLNGRSPHVYEKHFQIVGLGTKPQI